MPVEPGADGAGLVLPSDRAVRQSGRSVADADAGCTWRATVVRGQRRALVCSVAETSSEVIHRLTARPSCGRSVSARGN